VGVWSESALNVIPVSDFPPDDGNRSIPPVCGAVHRRERLLGGAFCVGPFENAGPKRGSPPSAVPWKPKPKPAPPPFTWNPST